MSETNGTSYFIQKHGNWSPEQREAQLYAPLPHIETAQDSQEG